MSITSNIECESSHSAKRSGPPTHSGGPAWRPDTTRTSATSTAASTRTSMILSEQKSQRQQNRQPTCKPNDPIVTPFVVQHRRSRRPSTNDRECRRRGDARPTSRDTPQLSMHLDQRHPCWGLDRPHDQRAHPTNNNTQNGHHKAPEHHPHPANLPGNVALSHNALDSPTDTRTQQFFRDSSLEPLDPVHLLRAPHG